MPGTAMAMALVRQCSVRHPLSKDELAKLANVARFTERAPALHLLCYLLESSSLQLGFLHPRDVGGELIVPRYAATTAAVAFNDDAATEYRTSIARGEIGLTHQLTLEEEQKIFDQVLPSERPPNTRAPPPLNGSATDRLVEEIERGLAGCVRICEPGQGLEAKEISTCPVSSAGEEHLNTALGKYHAERSEASWELHHRQPTRQLDMKR